MLGENSLRLPDLLSSLGPRHSPGTVIDEGLGSLGWCLRLGDLEKDLLLSLPFPALVVPLCLLVEGGDLLADGEEVVCLEGGVGDLVLFLALGTTPCEPLALLELFFAKALR